MFNIYLTKEMIQDDYEQGEIGKRTIWTSNELVASGKTIEEALDQIWENEAWGVEGEWRNNLGFMNDDDDCRTLLFCQTEKSDGTKADENAMEMWKAGKRKLYASYYFFRVEERHEVLRDELEKLELCKF